SRNSCLPCAFFFQAEDGIRDFHVTGVQTCALPIYGDDGEFSGEWRARRLEAVTELLSNETSGEWRAFAGRRGDARIWTIAVAGSSEERRVGRERSRWRVVGDWREEGDYARRERGCG